MERNRRRTQRRKRENHSSLPAISHQRPIAKKIPPRNGYICDPTAPIPRPSPPAKVIGVIVLPCVLLWVIHHLNSLKIKVVEARGIESLPGCVTVIHKTLINNVLSDIPHFCGFIKYRKKSAFTGYFRV